MSSSSVTAQLVLRAVVYSSNSSSYRIAIAVLQPGSLQEVRMVLES